MKYQLPRALEDLLKSDLVYFSVLLVSIAITSYGLGRLSVQVDNINSRESQALRFVDVSSRSDYIGASVVEGKYVASRKGTKYHLVTCSSGSQISEANRIYFSSEAEARAGGYTRASNCKGW
tara:strand:+ start:606 stop:971 length:366 start_codon:yes stop_codon:yes gene_type:complete